MPSDRPTLPAAATTQEPLSPIYNVLPQKEQRLHLWAQQLPALNEAEDSQKEWSAEYMKRLHETPQEGALGSIPLIVLTRAHGGFGPNLDVPAAELEEERLRLQSHLALLSSNGRQILVPSGHNMHLEAPDAVADAIRLVIDSCTRKKAELAH